jgi:hypothetical protein
MKMGPIYLTMKEWFPNLKSWEKDNDSLRHTLSIGDQFITKNDFWRLANIGEKQTEKGPGGCGGNKKGPKREREDDGNDKDNRAKKQKIEQQPAAAKTKTGTRTGRSSNTRGSRSTTTNTHNNDATPGPSQPSAEALFSNIQDNDIARQSQQIDDGRVSNEVKTQELKLPQSSTDIELSMPSREQHTSNNDDNKKQPPQRVNIKLNLTKLSQRFQIKLKFSKSLIAKGKSKKDQGKRLTAIAAKGLGHVEGLEAVQHSNIAGPSQQSDEREEIQEPTPPTSEPSASVPTTPTEELNPNNRRQSQRKRKAIKYSDDTSSPSDSQPSPTKKSKTTPETTAVPLPRYPALLTPDEKEADLQATGNRTGIPSPAPVVAREPWVPSPAHARYINGLAPVVPVQESAIRSTLVTHTKKNIEMDAILGLIKMKSQPAIFPKVNNNNARGLNARELKDGERRLEEMDYESPIPARVDNNSREDMIAKSNLGRLSEELVDHILDTTNAKVLVDPKEKRVDRLSEICPRWAARSQA